MESSLAHLRDFHGRFDLSSRLHAACRGQTLLEVTTLLVLLAVLGSSSAAGLGRLRDRLAVHGAREELAALIARGRAEAVLLGGARIVVTEDPPRATLVVDRRAGDFGPAGTVLGTPDLGLKYGVVLDVNGAKDRVELRFDALGLGSMTSHSFIFRRGAATAGLVVSSYGRASRS